MDVIHINGNKTDIETALNEILGPLPPNRLDELAKFVIDYNDLQSNYYGIDNSDEEYLEWEEAKQHILVDNLDINLTSAMNSFLQDLPSWVITSYFSSKKQLSYTKSAIMWFARWAGVFVTKIEKNQMCVYCQASKLAGMKSHQMFSYKRLIPKEENGEFPCIHAAEQDKKCNHHQEKNNTCDLNESKVKGILDDLVKKQIMDNEGENYWFT